MSVAFCSVVCPGTDMTRIVSAVAESFIRSLDDDLYPVERIERLFGIQMGTEIGQLVLGTWITLYKFDGFATVASINAALRADRLPEAFQTWVDRSRGSGYTEALKAKGFGNIPWMRMVDVL